MQISVTGHHVDVTDALRSYVESKFEKLERHFDHVTNVHVVLNVEKLRQMAEATMHLNGANLFANAEHEDMYAAIDSMTDKLDRQVIRHKEKMKDHRGNGANTVPLEEPL
ncbi:MAG: ribosome hibernation promoting factor [gamma proteobacterium symbiont of Bathyaustriella thionipta]|nr:ribosome hibernation promoting factor [gamma proteobacterium symbiont of Bathyaustriella thionipta]